MTFPGYFTCRYFAPSKIIPTGPTNNNHFTMPPYGEPDWATPGDTAVTTTTTTSVGLAPNVTASITQPTTNGNSAATGNNGRCIVLGLSVLNLALCAMMGGLGVVSLIEYEFNGVGDLTYAFLCAYMILFATLLFLYEFIWWQPVASLNVMFRKNFGFLYGLHGKGLYLIVIAFLTLGLLDDDVDSAVAGLDYITGLSWLAAGLLHSFVACTMPHVNAIYKPPTAGLVNSQTTGQDINPV